MTRTNVNEFVDRFQDFHDLSLTEQIIRLIFFHTVEERRDSINRSELEQLFRFADLPIPANLTQLLGYLVSRGKKLINNHGEFTLRREVRKRIEDELQGHGRENQQPSNSSSNQTNEDPGLIRRVWVVHGRDEHLRRGLFDFLRSLGLEPMEFSEARKRTADPLPYVGEILQTAFQHARAVVVLLTPDDEARLRPDLLREGDPAYERELTGQARPNVLFEAGMAFISHPERTILVQIGEVRPFSDVAGRHVVYMDGSSQRRQELASRLQDAGCSVNLSGTDWHTAGTLEWGKRTSSRRRARAK